MEAEPAADPPPTRLFSKPVIDPVNTVVWFLMDALWLAKLPWPAYVAGGLTVLTGVILLYLGRREGRGAVLADLGMNCWIVMNTVWMVHDLNGRETPRAFALVMAILGAVCLAAAARCSQPFRRVRIFKA